ncbi:serine hydrolase [Streptosporangium sp. 'caverna']|uniref:serine hydrolase domain-containing protein n=1 Tax=Streptosporangium sp. 'caverna' TaxID=2202249 RepID=UPI001EF95A68|nr:serine hydrolase domain-containing protein [Streptosporangium sp. 'caverna']
MALLSRRNMLKVGAGFVPALGLMPPSPRPTFLPPPPHPTVHPTLIPVMTVSGVVPAALAVFDTAMKTFITERKISCAQLAVAKKGKILLARGYRFRNGSPIPPPVTPTSLFRIASLSKHITSAAIMRLVQDGKLSLSAPVTTLLGLSATADPRLQQVTVLRLMQHLGGWDRDVSVDQLWIDHQISATLDVPLPIDHADIIRYATARPLDFAPGSKMVYSNYGYMLLGRIIEKVSGLSYESYVKQKLLTPAGISRMRLGRSLKSEAVSTEVPYESQYTAKSVVDESGATVPFPYGGFNMPNQDANGGWLASAVDMVKFSTVFDAAGPVLNAASIAKLFAKPETGITSGGSWYGGGWYVRTSGSGLNTWHTGSMPGTFTFLARLSSGVSYCAVFNRREETGSPDFDGIDPILGKAAGAVTSWPTTDLTSTYF